MEIQDQEPKKTLEERLQDRMEIWTNSIKELEENMKNIGDVSNLLNIVFIKRQECVEELQTLQMTTAKLNRLVQQKYTERYKEYKYNSQLRYTSDAAINTQVEVDLHDLYEKKDFMEIHTQMMNETLNTINKLISGIHARVEIYKIVNGIKF